MRLRLFGVCVSVLLVVAIVLAPAAQARSGYVVKNAAGKKVGSVTVGSRGKVWDCSGIQMGTYGPTEEGRRVVSPRKYGHYGSLSRHSGKVFSVHDDQGGSGRAVLKNGRWLLQQKIGGSWRTRGIAPKSVSGWAGCSALWVLLWR